MTKHIVQYTSGIRRMYRIGRAVINSTEGGRGLLSATFVFPPPLAFCLRGGRFGQLGDRWILGAPIAASPRGRSFRPDQPSLFCFPCGFCLLFYGMPFSS